MLGLMASGVNTLEHTGSTEEEDGYHLEQCKNSVLKELSVAVPIINCRFRKIAFSSITLEVD